MERGHQALPPLKLFTSENSTPSSSVLSHRSVVLHTKPLAFSPAVAQAPFSSSHKVGDARFGSCLAKAGWGSNLSLAMTMQDQTMSNEKRMMRPFQNKQISFFLFFLSLPEPLMISHPATTMCEQSLISQPCSDFSCQTTACRAELCLQQSHFLPKPPKSETATHPQPPP